MCFSVNCCCQWSRTERERKKVRNVIRLIVRSKTKKHIDTLCGRRYQRSGDGNGVHMGLQLVDDAAVVLAGLITLVSLLIMDDDDRCITIVL